MDFSLIKQSGLTQTEFGELVGVGRVTVNLWVKGKMKPNLAVQPNVFLYLEVLQRCIDNSELPPEDNLSDKRRGAHIKRVVAATRRSMREEAAA